MLRASPPEWALQAGLPPPGEDESFEKYVSRLGLDPEELLVGLNETTMVLANIRLASALMKEAPEAYADYRERRRSAAQ